MQREAKRTLLSVTSSYQDVEKKYYDVIAIDNGSSKPLNKSWVESFGSNFKYIYYDTSSPSPCAAINNVVKNVETKYVMICIDGARIFSPGIIKNTLHVIENYANPYVYTINMHIGSKPQNISIIEGYNQKVEDQLLDTINWKKDGYSLFNISSVGGASGKGYFSLQKESNCYSLKLNDFNYFEGLSERFTSKGGGLTSADFFNRINEDYKFQPVLLLGEGTFHQFHGGAVSNRKPLTKTRSNILKEYKVIRGKQYSAKFRDPIYYGTLNSKYHSKIIGLNTPSDNRFIAWFLLRSRTIKNIISSLTKSLLNN